MTSIEGEIENVDWKYLNDEKLYKIYNDGRIYSEITNNFMKHHLTRSREKNIYTINLFVNKKNKYFLIHRLVYEKFIGKIHDKNIIVFKDKDYKNLRYDNLIQLPKNGKYEENIEIEEETDEWSYLNEERLYKIYKDGRIYSKITDSFLKYTLIKKSNLLQTSVLINGKRERFYVHRLIYEKFIRRIDHKNVVIFIDGNYENLRWDNLKEVSKKDGEHGKNEIDYDKSIWKEIKGYEGRYIINKKGEIMSLLTGEILIRNLKYEQSYETTLLIDKEGKRKGFLVHHLVYFTFMDLNIEDRGRKVIDHIDNNRQNNNFENLRLVSYSENNENRILTKKIFEGLDQSKVIIKCDDFRVIGKKYKTFDFSNYAVNSYGQVKNIYTNNFLKTHFVTDYEHVALNCLIEKKPHCIRIHQIVATMFLDNPSNHEIVHHKDSNRRNNHFSNLEWTTAKQNTIYALGKKIAQYDLDDNLIKTYETVTEASLSIGNPQGRSQLTLVCKGERKTAYGYKWKWVD